MTEAVVTDRPLPLRVKILYGMGHAATMIKQRGLSFFLMIFYNQVVGLPPHLVSLAISVALVFDAVIDPMVGMLSDNFRSRWGRRHPFMYASALPFAISLFLLWNPPQGWEDMQLFTYMLACLLTLRFFDTFFELPAAALAPELAKSYDDRTKLYAFRAFFGVAGGLGMVVLAYQVFLRENPDGTGGVLERSGYLGYSATAALLVLTAILCASLGTHGQIPHLVKVQKRTVTPLQFFREVFATLKNRAFLIIVLAGICAAAGNGMKFALDIYLFLYFWQLEQGQMALIATVTTLAALAGVPLAPLVGRRLGKKWGAIALIAVASLSVVGLVTLRLVGLLPDNGSNLLLMLLIVDSALISTMGQMMAVLMTSMTADIVEDAEVKTGRRSEGLLLSADNLFKKMISGAGALMAGIILTVAAFPKGAKPGQVDPGTIFDLGLYFVLFFSLTMILMLTILSFYPITKARHEANLAILRARAEAAARGEVFEPEGAKAGKAPRPTVGPLATPAADTAGGS